MENKKPWYKSKTIIIAILMGITGIVTAFSSQYPDIGILLTLKSILDIGLRFATNTSVE